MLFSQTMPLSEVLKLGRFSPAMVQREFQWTTAEIARLFDDLLGAFDRIGDDPGEEEPEADTAAASPARVDHRQVLAPRPPGAASTAAADPADPALLDDTDDPPPAPPIRLAPRRIGRIDPPDCYFLGGLIFWNDGRSDKITVYDGLQRLTSLTILLCALRDGWREPAASDRSTLHTLLYADASGSEADRRVTFPTPGRTLAAFVGGIAPDRTDAASPGDLRMRDAARYFDRRFEDGWPPARRAGRSTRRSPTTCTSRCSCRRSAKASASRSAMAGPTPQMARTDRRARNAAASSRPITEKPSGLSSSDAILARNLLKLRPAETVTPMLRLASA